jgi:hypothetical protein
MLVMVGVAKVGPHACIGGVAKDGALCLYWWELALECNGG